MATTISLQRALDKINLLEKKIQDATEKINHANSVIAYVIGDKTVAGYKDNDEFATKAQAKLQSVFDLIEQRDKLKTAVINANATTEITVAGETLTIAAAIERRKSIQLRINLLKSMRYVHIQTINRFESEQERYRTGLNQKLDLLYSKDNKTKHDIDSDLLKPYREENEPRLIDPLNLQEQIDKLNEYINEFDNEVKFALTEANVRNEITIED